MTEHFTLTLDSRNETVEHNTPTRFSTRFPAPIQLGRDWEVALLDIRYPKSWWTIPSDDYFVEWRKKKLSLVQGFYHDPHDILEELSSRMKKWKPGVATPKLRYDTSNNRIEAKHAEGLVFSDALKGLLGIDPDQAGLGSFVGRWEVDLDSAFHRLFVYTDMIADGWVGDASAPLLRAVEVRASDRYGDTVHLSYAHPFYMPLCRRSISEIELFIADELGRPVTFRGKESVLATLHFRRRHGG